VNSEIGTMPYKQDESYEAPRLQTIGHARDVVLSAGDRPPGDSGNNNKSLISGVAGGP
jgi:hypothetical protein